MAEDVLVACMPAGITGIYVVPGSAKVQCERCGKDAWVSPSSYVLVRTRKYHPHFVCLRCCDERELALLATAMHDGPAPEQLPELHDAIRTEDDRG